MAASGQTREVVHLDLPPGALAVAHRAIAAWMNLADLAGDPSLAAVLRQGAVTLTHLVQPDQRDHGQWPRLELVQ